MTSRLFDRFVAALASANISDRACNQYSRGAGDLSGNAVRRRNLRLYLEEVGSHNPGILLVGEAPSHRGARLTGIPFVSETLMLSGVPAGDDGLRFLGKQRGYRKATPGPQLSTEASATIVWSTIRHIRPLPLLWNAFPFHPFEPGVPLSNRDPDRSEIVIGQPFLDMLLSLFAFTHVIAIGNHADRSLSLMNVPHEKVRHPSQGGKPKFIEGMARLSQAPFPEE